MSEDSRRILDMLAAGKITAAEAEQLLNALGAKSGDAANGKPRPKYLIVNVNSGESGVEKVNIRIPLQILRAGVKLASLIPPSARSKVNEALNAKGMHIDLEKIRPEDMEDFIVAMGEMTIDVNEERDKIRIYCE